MGKQISTENSKVQQKEGNFSEMKAYPQHCQLCFDVLISKCNNLKQKDFSSIIEKYPKQLLNFECPLFVTWHFTKNEELRGCIGTFAPGLLREVLPKFAIKSAFEDNRFEQIQLKEIADLSVGVSLLSSFQSCSNLDDWELGKHGVQIEFQDQKNNYYGGTFLPEVATDWKWTKEETISQLLKKASKRIKFQCFNMLQGYKGKLEDIKNIQLQKYETHKCWLSYDEYIKMNHTEL